MNPLLDKLEPVEGEKALNLDYEQSVLNELIQKAVESDSSSRDITRAIDLTTSIAKFTAKHADLIAIQEFNRVIQRFCDILQTNLPGDDLSGLFVFLTEGNHSPANAEAVEKIQIARRLLAKVAKESRVGDCISYISTVLKAVKTLHESAAKDKRLIPKGEVLLMLERVIGKAPDWLRDQTNKSEDEAADAVSASCNQLAQEVNK